MSQSGFFQCILLKLFHGAFGIHACPAFLNLQRHGLLGIDLTDVIDELESRSRLSICFQAKVGTLFQFCKIRFDI